MRKADESEGSVFYCYSFHEFIFFNYFWLSAQNYAMRYTVLVLFSQLNCFDESNV